MIHRLLPALCAALAIVPCLPPRAAARPITVVASIAPIADLVRQVAGPAAEVLTLLPPGVSPHTFEPTPGTIRAVSGSRIFFLVGAGLETWSGKLVSAAAPRDLVTVDLSQGVALIRDLEGTGSDRDREGHGHAEGVNPHYWTDPVIVQGLIDRIEAALAAAVPEAAAPIARRATELRGRLAELDAEIRHAVARFRSRRLVTFHNSWPYFARRYGLEVAGVIELSPGREPSPRHLGAIVAAIRALRVPVVYAEPQLPARPAEVIAHEAGVRILLLDPIGGVPPDRAGYLDLMRFNLRALEAGLRE